MVAVSKHGFRRPATS